MVDNDDENDKDDGEIIMLTMRMAINDDDGNDNNG